MNVYGIPLWRYNNHNNINDIALHGEKVFEDYGKYRTERTML